MSASIGPRKRYNPLNRGARHHLNRLRPKDSSFVGYFSCLGAMSIPHSTGAGGDPVVMKGSEGISFFHKLHVY